MTSVIRITVLGISWVLVTTLGVLEALPVRLGGHSELPNNVSCNFTSGLCGWTGSVSGGQWTWTTESAMNIKPPEGYAGFAFVTSKHESWAELRSEPFSLTESRILSFFILQQKFEISSDTVELVLHSTSTGSDVVIGSYRNAVNWRYRVLLLCPYSSASTIQLVFRFKVGSERNLAAVSGISLSDITNPETLRPPPPPPPPGTLVPIDPTPDNIYSITTSRPVLSTEFVDDRYVFPCVNERFRVL